MRAILGEKGNLSALLIIAFGAAAVLFGALRGEPALVLLKAIRICLECIGIG